MFFFIIFLFFFDSVIFAQIAVFPFEDISNSLNGIDFNISQKVAKKLIDKGYEVVFPDEISKFLDEMPLPITGWITKINAKKIGRHFKCNFILLGTITDYSKKDFTFSISLRMLDIASYGLIWANSISFNKEKKITFLNLKKVSWNESIDSSIGKVLSTIPEQLKHKLSLKPDIDIKYVTISPRYTRKKEKMTCTVKLIYAGIKPDKVFFVISDNRTVEAKEKHIEFTGTWEAPMIEKKYYVSLETRWQQPFEFKKKIFLTSFYVDNTPPEIKLKTRNIVKIKDKKCFSKYIKLSPVVHEKSGILKWIFEVFNKTEKKAVIKVEQYGKLPKTLIWKGTTLKGGKMPDGEYILKFTCFDKAKNKSAYKIKVFLIKNIHPVTIVAVRTAKNIRLKLDFKKSIAFVALFNLEIFDSNGSILAYKTYDHVPLFIDIKKFKGKLFYSYEIKDILGNKLLIRKAPLETIKRKKEKKKVKKREKWINDF